jgi:hypothetical protein
MVLHFIDKKSESINKSKQKGDDRDIRTSSGTVIFVTHSALDAPRLPLEHAAVS